MKHIFYILSISLFSTISCKPITRSDLVKDNFCFAEKQLEYAFDRIELAKTEESESSRLKREEKGLGELTSPRSLNADGSLHLVPSADWTSGFFPGELWYLYEYTNNPDWKEKAQQFTLPIEREKLNGRTHDMGFKVFCSFGNGYKLTGDTTYREILIDAAYTVCHRFNPTVGCIRSWDHNQDKWQYPVIIDNMMNLEHLFWAFRETGDSLFYSVAVSHAQTTRKNHFRPDNSCYHVIDYDVLTGNVLKKNTHQGFSHESAWSRGQAWALYGYTMCYRETRLPEFLEQAKKIYEYVFNHPNLPADGIPYWDFNAPQIPDEPRDASAAAIIASALYELSDFDTARKEVYWAQADKILSNLSTDNYRCERNGWEGFLLKHSTGSKPHQSEIDKPLVYADYYFLEALLRKKRREEMAI